MWCQQLTAVQDGGACVEEFSATQAGSVEETTTGLGPAVCVAQSCDPKVAGKFSLVPGQKFTLSSFGICLARLQP